MQFFLVLFLLFQMSKCFIGFIHRNKANYCLSSTCFSEDGEDYKPKPIPKSNYINRDLMEPPLYTLIWYDCESCKKLLQDMENLRLKNVYINGGEYFYDIEDIDNKFNTPLLYKEEVFIGDNLFDIYAEIYREM